MPTGTETELSEKGKAALTYIGMGLAVFPLGKGSKKPSIQGGSTQWTKGDEDVIEWWEKHPEDNVAIVAGAPSDNLVIIDVDVDEDTGEDGFETVNMWQKSHGEWPDTACVTTPHGGEHFFFRIPENVHNSADKNLGVDIRGIGGYVVAPPSVFRKDDGTEARYEWDLDLEDYGISQANQSVLDFIASLAKSTADTGERFKLPREIHEGERNDTLFRYACQMRAQSVPEPSIADFLMVTNMQRCKPPLNEGDVRDIAQHVIDRYPEGKSEEFTEEDERKAKAEFVKSKLRGPDGKVRNTLKNYMCVLETDPRFAGRFKYNEMAYEETVQLPLPWDDHHGARAVRDTDYTHLWALLESEFGLNSREKVIAAVSNVCDRHRYNPVVEWLDSLEWDGVKRIDHLLPYYLGVEDSEYQRAVMDLFMRGAIARATHPGCKFDNVLLIQGEQGVGKSYFLSLLAHDQSWFNDNLNVIGDDAAMEKIQGAWILEMSELLALKRSKDVEGVKSFLTSRWDKFRKAYARKPGVYPRVCVFAGTTNDTNFLTDPTGNRRYLVVESKLPANHPAAALFEPDTPHEIEQAWAEAYHEWKAGETRLVLPEHLLAQAETARARFEEEDTRIADIQDYLERRKRAWLESGCNGEAPRTCVKQLAIEALHMNVDGGVPRRTTNEIHEIMQRFVPDWRLHTGSRGRARVPGYGRPLCYELRISGKSSDFSGTHGDANASGTPSGTPSGTRPGTENEQLEL